MRKKIFAVAAAAFLATVGFAAPANAVSDTTADLWVLHGVPDTAVDVFVGTDKVLSDFQPGDLTKEPFELPTGSYDVVITAAGAGIDTPVISATLMLTAGNSYTAVAHLDADGAPTATLFTNDLSTIPAGEGKLTVRHTAAAPEVDILANGAPAFTKLSNPMEQKANLAVGTIAAGVAPTGSLDALLGADVQIQEGVNTIVYAWGSLGDDNLALAVQTIGGLHSNPGGVNSGQAGLAADPNPAVIGFGIAGLLALLVVGSVAGLRARAGQARG